MPARPAADDLAEAFTDFGPFLRYLRKRLRLTQQDLGIAVGYSTAQISLLENGQRRPDLTALAALFVPALHLQPEPELAARLLRLAAAARAGAGARAGDPGPAASLPLAEPLTGETTPAPGPPPAAQAPAPNLPAPSWPLIGRAAELEQLQNLLAGSPARLVTLLGPPGVGKTRLALQVGWETYPFFAGGASWVDLSVMAEAASLAGFVRQALGLSPPAGPTGASEAAETQRLRQAFRGRSHLLILDNFEHVVTQAGLLGELLETCPALRILVTSRLALRVYGEHEFPVPPLAVPDLAALPSAGQLELIPAVAVFMAGARAVRPDFDLTRENALAVAAICVRLEGLPLALELAAAHLKILTPAELAARLVNRLATLTRGPRNRPARQQTLRGAIGWSYQRLAGDEQLVFRHLGVFAGGCTAEAAQAVVGESAPAWPALETLCEANLVRAQPAATDTRFTLLDTLREYALEQLAAQGENRAAQERHAGYCLALAERAEPELIGPDQKAWFGRLGCELANLRAALAWSHVEAPVISLRLASALGPFWEVRGQMWEGRGWLEAGLQRAPAAPPEVRARALLAAGRIASRQGYFKDCQVVLGASRDLFMQLEEPSGLARALHLLGFARLRQGDFAASRALLHESLAAARSVQDTYVEAGVMSALAELAGRQGDVALARSFGEQALALSQARRDPRATAATLLNTAVNLLNAGDFGLAFQRMEASLAVARELDDYPLITHALLNLGNVLIAQGEPTAARACLEEAIAIHRAHHDHQGAANAYATLGRALERLGDLPAARQTQVEALRLRAEAGERRVVAVSLTSLARLDYRESQPTRAATLLGAAEAIRQAIGSAVSLPSRPEYEQLVAAVKAVLGEAEFTRAWAAGRALPLDQAVALALGNS
jgi:predicted ATPase/Tfp pilus assembly protein PilF